MQDSKVQDIIRTSLEARMKRIREVISLVSDTEAEECMLEELNSIRAALDDLTPCAS